MNLLTFKNSKGTYMMIQNLIVGTNKEQGAAMGTLIKDNKLEGATPLGSCSIDKDGDITVCFDCEGLADYNEVGKYYGYRDYTTRSAYWCKSSKDSFISPTYLLIYEVEQALHMSWVYESFAAQFLIIVLWSFQ